MNNSTLLARMSFLEDLSLRGTCKRGKVAAMITDEDGDPKGVGYNSAPLDKHTCLENECQTSTTTYADGRIETHCETVIHAEINAILDIATNSETIQPHDVIFVTHSPCPNCLKTLIQTGIKTIYYRHPYRLETITDLVTNYGIDLIMI